MIEKMSITVTAAHAQAIRAKLEEGGFASASEVVRAALRHWLAAEEADRQERLAAITKRLGSALLASPRFTTEEVQAGLQQHHPGGPDNDA